MASESLFHERQSLLNCAVHCLNNLYQQRWVDAAAMDALADRVAAENQASSWWNPYRSVLPRVGNYDVTVIVEALKQQDGSLAMHLLNNKHMNAVRSFFTVRMIPATLPMYYLTLLVSLMMGVLVAVV